MTQLNSYELALILRTDIMDEERNAILDRTKEIITGDKGVIVRIDEWGKRRLAYEIKDSLEGVYYFLYFESTSQTLDEVTRVLGITDGVLRYMPIRHEKPFNFTQPAATAPVEEVPVEAPPAEAAAPAEGAASAEASEAPEVPEVPAEDEEEA